MDDMTDGAAMGIDELKAQLSELQANLMEVQELMSLDPDDADVKAMHKDILANIKQTMQLMRDASKPSGAMNSAAPPAPPVTTSAQPSAVEGGEKSDTTEQPPQQEAPPDAPEVMISPGMVRIGALVNVFESGRAEACEVVRVEESVGEGAKQEERLVVTPIGMGSSQRTVPLSKVQFAVFTAAQWKKGQKVVAASPSNNVWSDAKIKRVEAGRAEVEYTSGRMAMTVEWVSLGRIQPRKSGPAEVEAAGAAERAKFVPHRQELKKDKKRVAKQNAWQSFTKKNKKARKATSGSMFKSPETLTGRVGVVGSGGGTTGEFKERMKLSNLRKEGSGGN